MTDHKLLALVQKVEAKTSSGELRWEATTVENLFQATLSTSILQISETASPFAPAPDFMLTILSKDGIHLESISDEALTKLSNEAELEAGYAYKIMGSIFREAKRQSLGVDKAINDILSELDQGKPSF
jgi:hypothetical protein